MTVSEINPKLRFLSSLLFYASAVSSGEYFHLYHLQSFVSKFAPGTIVTRFKLMLNDSQLSVLVQHLKASFIAGIRKHQTSQLYLLTGRLQPEPPLPLS